MSCRGTALVAALLWAAWMGTALAADAFEQAREKKEQAVRELGAMNAARLKGDQAAFEAHQTEAKRLLREAKALYEGGGAETSRDPEVLAEYGAFLLEMGDVDLAAKTYRRAVGLSPNDAGLWLRLGTSLSNLDESKAIEAKEAFERCLALDRTTPVAAQAYAELGGLYRGMGLFDLAKECFEASHAIAPDSVETRIALAALKVREGRIREGADGLDALGMIGSEHGALLQGLLVSALKDFDAARLWIPDMAEDHLAYAKLLLRAGRTPECLFAIERSLDLDERNYVVWNLLGSVSRQMGDMERARTAFRRSLALEAEQPRTRSALEALAEPQP